MYKEIKKEEKRKSSKKKVVGNKLKKEKKKKKKKVKTENCAEQLNVGNKKEIVDIFMYDDR